MITIKPKLAPSWFKFGDGDPAAEILLAPLSAVAWLDVKNEFERDENDRLLLSGRGILTAVKDAARDWRNVVDEKGEQIAFDRKLLEDLPPPALFSIALEVLSRTRLSETERKN